METDKVSWDTIESKLDALESERLRDKETIAKLREALSLIASGEGIYGEQAGQYKKIAKDALFEMVRNSIKSEQE